jgi:hypothetical protein
MTKFLLLALCLTCAGCVMPLTRSITTVPVEERRQVVTATWTALPASATDTVRRVVADGLAGGCKAAGTERGRALRRHWAANFDFIFGSTEVRPQVGKESDVRVVPNRLVLVSLAFGDAGIPEDFLAAGDGTLHLLLGGDTLPEVPVGVAWDLAFGDWPEVSGPAGRLSTWDPVKLTADRQPGSTRLDARAYGTGLAIDAATAAQLVALGTATPVPGLPVDTQRQRWVTSGNPLRWAATPITLLLDCFIFVVNDVEGKRRVRGWNRLRLEGMAEVAPPLAAPQRHAFEE